MKVTKYQNQQLMDRTKAELVEIIKDLKARNDEMAKSLTQFEYQTRTRFASWVDVQGEWRCENCHIKAPRLKDKTGIHEQIKPEYCFNCGSRMSNGERF